MALSLDRSNQNLKEEATLWDLDSDVKTLEDRTWILLLDLGRPWSRPWLEPWDYELSRTMLTLLELHLQQQRPRDIPAWSSTLCMTQLPDSLEDDLGLTLINTTGAAHDILAHSGLLLDLPEQSDTTTRQIVLLTRLEDPHLPRHPHTFTHSLDTYNN